MQSLRTLLLTAAVLAATALDARAEDLKLQAKLIWGSNDKPEDIQHKRVNHELAGDLQRTFKWQNYFEITNQIALIPVNKSYDFKMSSRCTLKIKNLGASRIEVSCIGEGKQVSKGVHTLPAKWLVLGGNDTNNTAWFVGLRALDSKLAEAKKPDAKN
jgi:hypothetical protein